jgi:RNA polymerase sigma-70 factor (ECF subfamily)
MSTALLAGLQAQHTEAWRRLVQLYGPVVYGWCKRRGLQPSDAEDITQEVFRTVLLRIASFRRERSQDTFRGWLWTITRNKLGDYIRRRETHPNPAGGSEARVQMEQVPAAALEDGDEAEPQNNSYLYRRALDMIRSEFEPSSWDAFWRVVVGGQRPADVAEALGLSLNAVYLAKSRVLRRLREELGDIPNP